MKSARPDVVPAVFVNEACKGSEWAADAAWVKPLPLLLGFAPYEVWDHPELLLSEQDRRCNPAPGPLAMVTMRTRIISALANLNARASGMDTSAMDDRTFGMAVRVEDSPAPTP